MLTFQVTKYTAAITSVWDGDHSGLHLNLKTESQSKCDFINHKEHHGSIRVPPTTKLLSTLSLISTSVKLA